MLPRHAANANDLTASARSPRLLEWLARLTQPGMTLDLLTLDKLREPPSRADKIDIAPPRPQPDGDDWNAVANICGYGAADFADAASPLPLTSAEIDHFRRNHRGIETHIGQDFLAARADLPSPLAEFYGLYLHRARVDTESALFLAQATGSTRVARLMGDLLAIGAFANGMEYIGYLGANYSVPAAFDTAAHIDRANAEALRRLAMPTDNPSHLLHMTPDELGVLASSIAERTMMSPQDFLEKANLLSESRQDVNRLPPAQHFATAVIDHDLPVQTPWVARLCAAFAHIMPRWVAGLPETESVVN